MGKDILSRSGIPFDAAGVGRKSSGGGGGGIVVSSPVVLITGDSPAAVTLPPRNAGDILITVIHNNSNSVPVPTLAGAWSSVESASVANRVYARTATADANDAVTINPDGNSDRITVGYVAVVPQLNGFSYNTVNRAFTYNGTVGPNLLLSAQNFAADATGDRWLSLSISSWPKTSPTNTTDQIGAAPSPPSPWSGCFYGFRYQSAGFVSPRALYYAFGWYDTLVPSTRVLPTIDFGPTNENIGRYGTSIRLRFV